MTDRTFAMYLRSIGLTQGDRLSMAHSVEARVPLVDYRLIKTVIGLRKAGAGHREAPKAWRRAAIADLLPAEVLSRAGAEAMSVMKAPPGGYHWLPFAVLVLEVWCREMEAMLTS